MQKKNAKNTKNDKKKDINRRHRLAQYIQRASASLYTQMYFDGKEITTDAIVSGLFFCFYFTFFCVCVLYSIQNGVMPVVFG